MKILLLGGTSFFGKEIVRRLASDGHDVTLFTRGIQNPDDIPPVTRLKGDRTKKADLETAKGTWDCVIDNTAYDGESVRAALGLGKIGRYVLTSTVSVYRFTRDPYPIPWKETAVDYDLKPPEEDPADVHWKYARGKLEAEKAAARQDKVPWTILRPTVVYGPFDTKNRGFWYLERLRQGGPILLANGGAGSFRLVFSEDCARGIVQAATSKAALGRAFNLAQKEIITLEDFLRESARALEVTADLLPVPQADLGELGGPHGSLVNIIPDTTAAKDIGFEPTPFPRFASQTAAWFEDSWAGDPKELLATRAQEIAFAEQWKGSRP